MMAKCFLSLFLSCTDRLTCGDGFDGAPGAQAGAVGGEDGAAVGGGGLQATHVAAESVEGQVVVLGLERSFHHQHITVRPCHAGPLKADRCARYCLEKRDLCGCGN